MSVLPPYRFWKAAPGRGQKDPLVRFEKASDAEAGKLRYNKDGWTKACAGPVLIGKGK